MFMQICISCIHVEMYCVYVCMYGCLSVYIYVYTKMSGSPTPHTYLAFHYLVYMFLLSFNIFLTIWWTA